VIEAAAEVAQLLLPRRQQEVAWCIKEAVPRALLAIGTDDLRTVPREALTEGVTRLATLANGGSSSTTSVNSTSAAAAVGAARAAEQLQLGLALKLFRCAQLEKRLQGLMLIRELVLAVDHSAAKQAPGQRTASFNGVAAHVLAPMPTAGSKQQQRPFVWADAAFVQDWLLQSEVIEELFGGSSHVELVKRADAVLSFLARRGALTALHLECLWACAEGRHEAVVSVLYSQILDLVPALQPHLRLFLFSCIAGTPFARYSAQTLQLVHDFTLKALQAARKSSAAAATAGAGAAQPTGSILGTTAAGAGTASTTAGAGGSSAAAAGASTAAGGSADASSGAATAASDGSTAAAGRGDGLRKGQVVHCVERAWLGFSVLWQYAMDEPGTSEAAGTQLLSTELTEMAVELLVALLAEPEIVPERTSLINRCLENVAQQRSVPASLMVLKRSISTAVASATPRWFSMRSASSSSCSSGTLEGLQRSRDVLGSVIKELESYCSYVSAHYGAAAAASASAAERLNAGRLRLQGVPTRFTHLQHLQARLDFLMFALTRSSLSLTEAQLDTLWSCLVLQACTPQAADLALEWLQRACADPADDDTLAAAAAVAVTPSGSASPLVDASSSGSSSAALGPLMRAYLFSAKLEAAAEVVTMRPAAARLFLLLFVQLNGRARAMRRVPAAPLSAAAAAAAAVERAEGSADAAQAQEAALLSGWVRHSMELAGLDVLWAMALDAADELVATSACALLIELHRRLGSKLAAKSDRISDQFVQQCLGKLAEAVPLMLASGRIAAANAAAKSSSAITATTSTAITDSTAAAAAEPTAAAALHTRRVRRCIGLLRRFLAAKSAAGTSSSSSSSSAAAAASQDGSDSSEAVVEVVTGPQLLPAVEVRLPGSASVLELRAALARHFDEVCVTRM
jgi:hypothetical protein